MNNTTILHQNKTFSKANSGNSSKEVQAEILLRPYTHITQAPLPDMWKRLAEAFNFWLEVPQEEFKKIESAVEIHQYYSLILDDIQNNRNMRDGLTTAHCAYGIPTTISTYSYCIITALQKFYELHPEGLQLFEELVQNTCIARGMELYWYSETFCPTEKEYYQIIIKKTYGLLTSQVKLMQLFSSTKNYNFTKLAGIFGLYFEILQDYRILKPKDVFENYKNITFDRFSLPIIHAIKTQPNNGRVISDILRLRTKNEHLIKYVLSLLERFKSFEYTEKVLAVLKKLALQELDKLDKSFLMETFFEDYFDNEVDTYKICTSDDINEISCIFSVFEKLDTEPSCTSSYVQEILRPFQHMQSVPGKNIRAQFITILNIWFNVSVEKVTLVEDIINNLHAASLLIDDIQDGSVLRRGIPVADSIYGIAKVINAALYIISITIEKLRVLNDKKAVEIYLELTEPLSRGQGIEIYWRENCICPTEEEYLEMIKGKTGVIFLLISRLLNTLSIKAKNTEDLTVYIGQYFQINDDYKNLTSKSVFDSKGFCEDLTEGKFGFPVIHAINSHPQQANIILDILRQRTYDVEKKKYCLALIDKCGGFEYTKQKLKDLRNIIVKLVSRFDQSELLVKFLEEKMF